VNGLELDRWQIAKTRMEALGVVDIGDEPTQAALGVLERLGVVERHLLALERREEALGLGIVLRVANRRHADPGTRVA